MNVFLINLVWNCSEGLAEGIQEKIRRCYGKLLFGQEIAAIVTHFCDYLDIEATEKNLIKRGIDINIPFDDKYIDVLK